MLQEPDKLEGFMRTGCGIIQSEGHYRFLGQVLEFISGDTVNKGLQGPQHTSIFVIQRMLLEVRPSP